MRLFWFGDPQPKLPVFGKPGFTGVLLGAGLLTEGRGVDGLVVLDAELLGSGVVEEDGMVEGDGVAEGLKLGVGVVLGGAVGLGVGV